jgi:hypothetical protein
MVQLTPNFDLPYPEATDNVNLWEHLQALAEAAEDALTNRNALCRLVATATQSIPHNTRTALTFGAEDDDVLGWHSTSVNTSRITPNIPGRFAITGCVYLGGRADYSLIVADFGKNGTAIAPAERQQPNTANNARSVAPALALQQANGTTDYFELYATHTNGASAAQATNQSSQFSSVFQVVYLGP